MSTMMMMHIGAGAIVVLAGAAALFSRKGETLHRGAGIVFVLSMIVSAGAGAWLAFIEPMMIATLAGIFTIYLVITSWRAARLRDSSAGFADMALLLAALAIAVAGALWGVEARSSPDGLKDGFSAEPYFIFGGLALLAAIFDATVLVRKGVAGRQRIARHLWRMAFAFFIAAGSLFTGPGADAFPEPLRGSPILSAPEPIILLLMVFWLVRVLFTGWWKTADTP